MAYTKQSSVSAPPTSANIERTSSKVSSQMPKMTSRTSSTRSSGSAASTSASFETTPSKASSQKSCDCLRCSPEAGFCKFSNPRKSDENFDASKFPFPNRLLTDMDTRRLSRNDDPLMHLNNLADQEDRAFNSFMQAACQYNKSTTMAVAACKKLIQWFADKSPETEYQTGKVTEDAALVHMALANTLVNSIAVGNMANAVAEVRSTVHSPTAKKMFNDPSSDFSKFTGQSMSADLDGILPEDPPYDCFSPEYGSERLREYLEDIKRNAAMAQDSLASGLASKYATDAIKATLSTFYEIQKNLKGNPDAEPCTAACKSALETTSANMRMLGFLNKQLTTATETTSILVDMATEHASRTRRRLRWSTLKHLHSNLACFLKYRTADKAGKHYVGNAIMKQLELALFDNMRTIDAVQQAKQDIENATLIALEPVEYMTGGRTPTKRMCLNVKVESVY